MSASVPHSVTPNNNSLMRVSLFLSIAANLLLIGLTLTQHRQAKLELAEIKKRLGEKEEK